MRFRSLLIVSILAWSCFVACNGSSGPDSSDEDEGGGGVGGASEGECSMTGDAELILGEGVGSAFEAFEAGDTLGLEFASQAGMEAAFSILGSEVALADVSKLEVALMVGEYAIGESTASGESLRCVDGYIRLDTAVEIDVELHPDIKSVVQLAGEEAELVVKLFVNNRLAATESVLLILEP